MKKIKVLIVGAGPAGCSTAFFLKYLDKDENIDVKIVDKLESDKYDRYHDMCGEATSTDILKDISPLKPKGIVGKINQIKEFYPNDIEIKTKMDGILFDRPVFFNSIVKEFIKLGGKYQIGTSKDFSQKNNKVKIKFNDGFEEYDYVVAADGANSIFRKKIGLKGHTKTLLQYVVEKKPIDKKSLIFHYDEKYQGDYLWEFPHNGNTKIGFPLIKGKSFDIKEKILKKQARLIAFGGLKKYTDNRIALVGDAACQVNPITKGGIRPSMVAGKLAAKAIINRDIKQYQIEWGKTAFCSKIFMDAFQKLKNMDNKELVLHMKPFIDCDFESFFSKCKLYIRIFLFYRKYLDLYKAYELSNNYGW